VRTTAGATRTASAAPVLLVLLLPLPPLEPLEPEDPDEPLDPPVDVGAADEVEAVPFSRIALRTNASSGSHVAVTLPALITPTPPMPQVDWSKNHRVSLMMSGFMTMVNWVTAVPLPAGRRSVLKPFRVLLVSCAGRQGFAKVDWVAEWVPSVKLKMTTSWREALTDWGVKTAEPLVAVRLFATVIIWVTMAEGADAVAEADADCAATQPANARTAPRIAEDEECIEGKER